MKKWSVDIDRLVTVLSDRMYSNQALAGLRELISNSIDAKWDNRPVDITIWLDEGIVYRDNGKGIHDFEGTYGIIGSGVKSGTQSIGMFGIGRLSLISKLTDSSDGVIITRNSGEFTSWHVNRSGYEMIHNAYSKIKDLEKNKVLSQNTGFYLDFDKLDLDIDPGMLIQDISKIFSLPLLEKQCNITINYQQLDGLIPTNYQKRNYSDIDIYYTKRQDGKIHYCHRGILIREEDYSGLDAWVTENYLDIKTDREGYVNNGKYQRHLKRVKAYLHKLRPKRTLQKLEVDFINGVMGRFRIFMKKSGSGSGPIIIIPKKIPIVSGFDLIDSNVSISSPNSESLGVEKETSIDPTVEGNASSNSMDEYHKVKEPPVGVTPTGGQGVRDSVIDGVNIPGPKTIEEAPDTPETERLPDQSKGLAAKVLPKRERIIVSGTRAVDLKDDYPMIFFEVNPFTFIFNTTHPILKDMIEVETIEPKVLSVIFERMLECFYLKDSDRLEEVKTRWTEVDTSLSDFL